MTEVQRKAARGTVTALAFGVLAALAGSHRGQTAAGVPIFAWCAAWAFGVNWVALIPAYRAKTEKYYDLIGSLTYLSTLALAILLAGVTQRAFLLGLLIGIWAGRLGSFLFRRVLQDGSDGRFDKIKLDPFRFAMSWTLQGLWVICTASAALAAITGGKEPELDLWAWLGLAVWLVGFGIEVVADQQKRAFRSRAANEGRFITSGLWAWSRHPNYFGEVVLWAGITVIAAPALEGWQLLTLAAPVFVYLLLNRVSGVPMLEARAERRWGGDPEFRAYTESTPIFFPRPPAAPAPSATSSR